MAFSILNPPFLRAKPVSPPTIFKGRPLQPEMRSAKAPSSTIRRKKGTKGFSQLLTCLGFEKGMKMQLEMFPLMDVYGGFRSHRGTPFFIHFHMIFHYKPTSFLGTSILGNPYLWNGYGLCNTHRNFPVTKSVKISPTHGMYLECLTPFTSIY